MYQAVIKELCFNPRTPRGVRLSPSKGLFSAASFQSTHPTWGATIADIKICVVVRFQSTHPTWGATHICRGLELLRRFNPRTPRGVRHPGRTHIARVCRFNPRTPRGVRRYADKAGYADNAGFNPRTPRGVRQVPVVSALRPFQRFNPRTPRGVRPAEVIPHRAATKFQSTHPTWGATGDQLLTEADTIVSIHAPHVGCDANRVQRKMEI